MKVLIVDDNDQSLYLLRTQLERAGHEVWPASDGAEALALAAKHVPDAIISDILMPRLDGFALCRAVRQSERLSNVPVILYSATYTDARDRELGLAVGADRFIEKPSEPEDLLRELEAAVAERLAGAVKAPPQGLEESTYLREYNERLVRKLEDKMLDVERAYRDLAESERRYHELFDVATDVIFTLSAEGKITLVNRRIQEILGHHPADVAQRPFEQLVAPTPRARTREAVEEALGGQRITLEVEFLTADGRTVPMHVVLVPLWQGQRTSGLMGIARDITEIAQKSARRVDEARRQAQDDACRDLLDELEGPIAQARAELARLGGHDGLAAADRATLEQCASRLGVALESLRRPMSDRVPQSGG